MTTIIDRIEKSEKKATLADWQRYRELAGKAKLSAKEEKELDELIPLLGLTAAVIRLHDRVVQRATECEQLVREHEAAVAAYDKAQKASEAARKRMIDEIFRLQHTLVNADFPEHAAALESQHRQEERMHASAELSTLYYRWPCLFGLPIDTPRSSSESYSPAIMAAIEAAGLSVFGGYQQ